MRLTDLLEAPPLLLADVQFVLTSRGEDAHRIADIAWVLFVGAALIFLLVLLMLAVALRGSPHMRSLLGRRSLIVTAGILFPVVGLSALLVYSFTAASSMIRPRERPAALIEVTGEMWWWRVRYLNQAGEPLFETANDIRIPTGVPVVFLLKSDNVIHSFWVPNLAGKLDMVPGRVNRLRVVVDRPGLFRGQCAEYCGAQHAKMLFDVQALLPEDFQRWLTAQREPTRDTSDSHLQHGKQIFMQLCSQCHALRGTQATSALGPDLTHVGSRLSLGAGVLPNNVGTLAGWIVGNQHIKPGNQMPSFDQLSGEELRAVASYLESLK